VEKSGFSLLILLIVVGFPAGIIAAFWQILGKRKAQGISDDEIIKMSLIIYMIPSAFILMSQILSVISEGEKPVTHDIRGIEQQDTELLLSFTLGILGILGGCLFAAVSSLWTWKVLYKWRKKYTKRCSR
jgi:positive regulator of sigma E activity